MEDGNLEFSSVGNWPTRLHRHVQSALLLLLIIAAAGAVRCATYLSLPRCAESSNVGIVSHSPPICGLWRSAV